MKNVMCVQPAEDQASPLTLPLVFDWKALRSAISPLSGMDRNNRIWLIIVGGSAPAFGSAMSVVLWCSYVWAILSLTARRFANRPNGWIWACAAVTGAYAIVKLGFSLFHSGLDGWPYWTSLLIFFSPYFLLLRLRQTPQARIIDLFVLGSGVSAVLAVPVAAYETMWVGIRASSFCGNPGIFAVMAILFGSIGALNVMSGWKRRRWLGILSYLAMVFCVLASGMRAVWIIVPIVTAVIVWAAAGAVPKTLMRRGLLASLAALLVGMTLAAGPIWHRAAIIGEDVAKMQQTGDYDSSTGRRVIMLEGALKAIMDAPLAGYGVPGRMPAVWAHLPKDMVPLTGYTHPHNGYLAAMLDAGLLGLAALLALILAPVCMAVAGPRDSAWRVRLAIGGILTATYAISGAAGIMFEHDLMDAAFVLILVVITASIPARDTAGEGDPA
jgi:O-antigen ligase